MTLDARQRVVARLLTDPAYQAAFFSADPGAAAQHGLTEDEMRTLRVLDRRRLAISSEGYMGKRFERVESTYPRTLALLDRVDPRTRGDYLATTPFPPSEPAELATFRAYVAREGVRPAPVQRLVLDLADLETLLAGANGGLLTTRGPLDAALEGKATAETYPDAPARFTVRKEGPAVRLEPHPVEP